MNPGNFLNPIKVYFSAAATSPVIKGVVKVIQAGLNGTPKYHLRLAVWSRSFKGRELQVAYGPDCFRRFRAVFFRDNFGASFAPCVSLCADQKEWCIPAEVPDVRAPVGHNVLSGLFRVDGEADDYDVTILVGQVAHSRIAFVTGSVVNIELDLLNDVLKQ